MKQFSAIFLAGLMGFSMGATLPRRAADRPNASPNATSAAFRDGLHLGRLDGQSGRSPHVSIGRWSNEADRALFAVGYEAGYRNSLAGVTE